MTISVLRSKSPQQVRTDLDRFAARYVEDWESWMAAVGAARQDLFGRILRKWQATRPVAMRRLRQEAKHSPPFLDDLLEQAADPVRTLKGVSLVKIAHRTSEQSDALTALWSIFSRLPTSGVASCVGITKAVMLLTEGAIGPAFDSEVRKSLGVGRPGDSRDWIQRLEEIGDDIAAFESAHGPLAEMVPSRFARLKYGRLYDMALGPR